MPALPQPFITALLALQFVAFGWRINREITVGDAGRRTWLPLPDWINLVSLLCVTLWCVVMPLLNRPCPKIGLVALSAGYVMIAFHPISEAAHYRLLFSKQGRSRYENDYPWITDQEKVSVATSIIFASIAGFFAVTGISK